MLARIDRVGTEYFHAITTGDDKDRVFVHQSECNFWIDECQPGDVVDITYLEDTDKGLRGRGCTYVRRPDATEGTITFIGSAFAMMRPDGSKAIGTNKSPDDVMCHITNFADYRGGTSATFAELSRGERVAGVILETPRGRRASGVQRIES